MTADERATYRLVLEYDGRHFEGWQVQAGERAARTVQGVLGEALAALGLGPARITAAGRTDAGVHAEGQVAGVEIARAFDPAALVRALNAHLPEDVAVWRADRVSEGWHATDAARGKLYRYAIWNGETRSPLRTARMAWIAERLEVERMRAAAAAFVGCHDFAALRAAGSSAKTSVRTVHAVEVRGRVRGEITIEVRGEGFLRHMVRNLAGTLIEVGRGRFEAGEMGAILASRDRARAGPTAPAHGLSLVRVWDSSGFADPPPAGGRSAADPEV